MAEELTTAEKVERLRRRWNGPSKDHALQLAVGERPPEGDTRATAAGGQEAWNSDDADQPLGAGNEGYEDMTVKELKAEIDRRNEGRDDDDMLSKSGNRDELVARLEEDDEDDSEE